MKTARELFAILLFGGFCLFSDMSHADPKAAGSVYCKERQFDASKIAFAKEKHIAKDRLHAIVANSPELSESRASDINVMIEEAYAYKGDIADWVVEKLADCAI